MDQLSIGGCIIGVAVDPDLEPGTVLLRSDAEQGIIADVAALRRMAAGSAELSEDLRSLAESASFIIRIHDAGEPVTCECCGTLVVAVPEAESSLTVRHADRKWRRAIWESQSWRKHTMRRCEWKRRNR